MTDRDPTDDPAERDIREGQIEYDTRTAIRDLIRVSGFEKAREKIAYYLIDEAGSEARKWQRLTK